MGHAVHPLQPQPLLDEMAGKPLRPRIGEHAGNLRVEHLRLPQLPLLRTLQQLVIGKAAP